MARWHAVSLIAILTVTAVRGFVLVDVPFVYQDARYIRTPSTAPAGFAFTGLVPSRRFTQWTMRQTPTLGAAHLVNLGLHMAAGVLVAGVMSSIAGPTAAVVAAGVHLLHPLNAEAVDYVTGRAEILVTLGALLAVWGAMRRPWWRWGVVAVGLGLASTSKEIGVISIGLVLAMLLMWRQAERRSGPALSALWMLGGAVLGSGWASVVSWLTMTPWNGGAIVPWAEFVVRQNGMVWALLLKVIVPRHFSIDHDALLLSDAWLTGSALATMWTVAATGLLWRRAPVVASGVIWAAIALAPRLLVPTAEFVTEHHLYLALVGVSMAVGATTAAWLAVPRSPSTHSVQFWSEYFAQSRAVSHAHTLT